MITQVVPLQPMWDYAGAVIHAVASEGAHATTGGSCRKLQPMDSQCSSRLPVRTAAHREEPMLGQEVWQELMPVGNLCQSSLLLLSSPVLLRERSGLVVPWQPANIITHHSHATVYFHHCQKEQFTFWSHLYHSFLIASRARDYKDFLMLLRESRQEMLSLSWKSEPGLQQGGYPLVT